MTLTAAQHEHRAAGIGGSDAPTIAMVDAYKQPFELYMEKIGEWPAADLSANDAVHFGNLLEERIGQEWARRTDRKVRRDNRSLVHPEHPWMRGHIDFRVEGAREGVEVKNRNWFMARHYGKSGSDEVYESDLVQCQHYMALTGWATWHVAVYFGGADFRRYTVHRDEDLVTDLLHLEHQFWRGVETRTPPPLAFEHGTIGVLLDRLYPGTDATVVELPAQAEHWHRVLTEATEHRKAYEGVEDGARLHLRELMGYAAVGLLPRSEGGYTRKVVERSGYTVADTSYLDFRYRKKPPGVTKQ